jgi:hypothetical protein
MLKRDGRGVEVNVFFCFHLTCGRRKGKGWFFIFKFFYFSLFKIKFPPNVITIIYQIDCEALYIWSAHYARSAGGWGLFDDQKQTVVQGCLNVVRGCFRWPFSPFVTFLLLVTFVSYFLLLKGVKFVTFFTACNFHKLLFYCWQGPGELFY